MAFGMSAAQVGMVSVGTSLLGSAMQSGSSGQAQQAQQKGTDAAIAEQRRQYDRTRSDNAPYLATGTAANRRLASLLGLSPDESSVGGSSGSFKLGPYEYQQGGSTGWQVNLGGNWTDLNPATTDFGQLASANQSNQAQQQTAASSAQSSPDFGSLNKKFSIADFNADPVTQLGYQSGLDLGTRGINNKAAANGGRDNGGVLKALTRFGTDYTGMQAGASRDRFIGDQNNIYNRLAGLSGTGQQAVNTGAAAGANSAGNISGLLSAQGNANGAASIARGNAWQGGLQNIGNQFMQQSTLSQIIGNNRGGALSNQYGYGNVYGAGGGGSVPTSVNWNMEY